MELYNETIKSLHNKLVNKEISSIELTNSVFARIDEVEPKVQAYISCKKELALDTAKKVDEKIARGEKIAPLAGIPAALKDNMCTQNILTSCGSKMLENFIPPYNATVVNKLIAQDYVLIGKTNMDEFAMGSSTETSYFHKTYNPWNLNNVPGGSSGGSAAAVAAGEAIWTLGSDTGGSIRQPASFNGVVGVKPTYGAVSRYGVVAMASSTDTIGCFASNASDANFVMEIMAGQDSKDMTTLPDFWNKELSPISKIGVISQCMTDEVDGEVKQKTNDYIKKL